jgi:hypothetical protein
VRSEAASAGFDLGPDELHFKSHRGQPLREVLWVRPHLEHQVKWRTETAIDNELFIAGRFFFQVFRQAVPGCIAAQDHDAKMRRSSGLA